MKAFFGDDILILRILLYEILPFIHLKYMNQGLNGGTRFDLSIRET